MLEMANARLYPFWGSLTERLRTGHPQNEAKTGEDFFAALYQDQARLRQFLHAMTGLSMGAAAAIADKFPWDRYHTVIDIGAAEGCVPAQLALAHPHLTGGGFDLPAAGPAFDDHVASHSLAGRLRYYPGDFFTGPLPPADVLIMGHILHDWGLEEKLTLLRQAYDALPDGGALIVYESIIDDDRTSSRHVERRHFPGPGDRRVPGHSQAHPSELTALSAAESGEHSRPPRGRDPQSFVAVDLNYKVGNLSAASRTTGP